MSSGFTKNVAITIFSRGFYIFFGLIFSILIARYFGPEGKGIISLMAVISATALQFGNLGLANALTYFVAKNKEQAKSLAINSLIFGLVLGVLVGLIGYLIYGLNPSLFGALPAKFIYFTLLSLPLVLIGQFFYNILLGQERIVAFNAVQVLGQVLMLTLGLITIFVLKSNIFFVSLIPILIIPLFIFVSYSSLIFKERTYLKIGLRILKEPLIYGFKLFIASLLAFLILKSDTFLVNYFLNLSQVGYYSIASSFADYLSLIPILIGTILFPRVTALQEKANELTAKVSRITFLLMIILCLGAAMLAKPFILLLYGQAFLPAFLPFILLIPGMFFWSLSIIFNNYFASQNKLWPPIISALIGFVINLSLNLVYIPRFGIIAAALASSLAYFIAFLLNAVYLIKSFPFNFSELFLIKKEDWQTVLNNLKING